MINDILTLRNMINDDSINIYEDDNHNIIVDGDIIIFGTEYNMFPVKIHKVNGNISWYGGISNNQILGSLTTLENFPDIITGNVYIFKNPKLKSLKGVPKIIGGSLVCDHCNISDISDLINTTIKGSFIASYNPISDVSVLEKMYVNNNIELIETPWVKKHEVLKTLNDSSIVITAEHANIF